MSPCFRVCFRNQEEDLGNGCWPWDSEPTGRGILLQKVDVKTMGDTLDQAPEIPAVRGAGLMD